MINNANGRRWARTGLIIALLVSIVGNVADVFLKETDVSLGLRVPGAVVWPVFVFFAIEILVRITWRTTKAHYLARALLLSPIVPAAIVSFAHLRDFLLLSGEGVVVQISGPIAVDGLMIGCTVALLVTRSLPTPPSQVPLLLPAPSSSPSAEEMEALREQWEGRGRRSYSPVTEAEETLLLAEVLPSPLPDAPVSPAPAFSVSSPPAPSRPGRGSSWPVAEVVKVILDGGTNGEAMAAGAPSPTTLGRTRQAVALLREDPNASIPPGWKVPPAVAQVIREMVPR